jgi:hypothetical protein
MDANRSEPAKLKLYIVGESSGNPEDWQDDGQWSLVFAESPEQARELAGDWPLNNEIAEVSATEPGVMHMNWPARWS